MTLMPCNASYSATKALVSNLGMSLYYELKSNIDVTTWEPGFVESNIHVKPPPASITLKTPKAVSDILKRLGKEMKTGGSL